MGTKYTVKETKRGWLDTTGGDHYTLNVEAFPGYGRNENTTYVDVEFYLSDGSDKVYLGFNHERGDRKSIRAARAKYEKLSAALEVIEAHLRDAEDNCDMEAAERKAKPESWEA